MRHTMWIATAFLALATTIAGCGRGADDTSQSGADSAASPVAGEPAGSEHGDEAPSAAPDGRICTEGGSIEFDTAIGWQVTGPEGTEVEIDESLVSSGSATEMSNDYSLTSDPRVQLYTGFIDEATITVAVTTGGPATLELFYGNVVEGGEFGEYAITETLETREIPAGSSDSVTATNPCP